MGKLQTWKVIRIGRWSLGDPRDRMLLSAQVSFLVDLLYALYHGALGLRDGSAWFLTLCVYYGLLGAIRLGATLCGRKENLPPGTEAFVTRTSGGLLILLSLVLAGVGYLSFTRDIATQHDTILMITIATYTFVKLGLAIARAVRWRRDPSHLLAVIRCVGYAELATSVFTMQRSMIVSFGGAGDGGMGLLNILAGTGVFFFVLALGLSLVFRSKSGNPSHSATSDQ